MAIDEKLLAILVCPVDRGGLTDDGEFLTCRECGRRYPVEDGIPVMLADQALPPTPVNE